MPAMTATSSRTPARNLRKHISDLKSNAPKQHIARADECVVLRLQRCGRALYSAAAAMIGGMAEWLKPHAWKACIRATVSWVRIPLPPPERTLSDPDVVDGARVNARELSRPTWRTPDA